MNENQASLPLNGTPSAPGGLRPDAPARGTIVGIAKTREVFINGVELLHEESRKVRNISPEGYAWGYEGKGPLQLSLAILLKFLPAPEALRLTPAFQKEFLAARTNRKEPFCLLVKHIRAWLGSKGVRV